MTKIIKIDENQGKDFGLIETEFVNGEEVKVIKSAKLFYEALGYDTANWKRWYEKNIENNPFSLEGVDYQPLVIKMNRGKGNFAQDFKLTLDFAERLAMMARTERGEEIRRYFQRERDSAKKLREVILNNIPQNEDQIVLQAMNILNNKVKLLEEKTKEQQNIIIAQDKKLESKSALEDYGRIILGDEDFNLTITEICDRLQRKPKDVNEILVDLKILKEVNKQKVPTEKYKYSKYCRLLKRPAKGNPNKIIQQLFWSSYGEALIIDKIKGLEKDSYKIQLIPINNSISLVN